MSFKWAKCRISFCFHSYRVNHKGNGFRDGFPKFKLSVSLHSWFLATVNLILSNQWLSICIKLLYSRQKALFCRLVIVIFKEFRVLFTVSSFVGNSVQTERKRLCVKMCVRVCVCMMWRIDEVSSDIIVKRPEQKLNLIFGQI